MTEAKSAAGLIDHVLRKHGYYSQAECADISGTIGADLIAVVLSYAAERERLLADADAALVHLDGGMCMDDCCPHEDTFQEAIARHKSRLSSHPATEGKGDD